MSHSIVAKRYAKALFELAQERNQVTEVEVELRQVVDVFKTSEELYKLITHPGIDLAVKKELLQQHFQSTLSHTVFDTLCLLIDRKRTDVLEGIVSEYVKFAGEYLGKVKAIVSTPKPLSSEELKTIALTFEQQVGKKIQVESIIDETLLGGISVRIGDRIYDGSLAGKLNRLEKLMKQEQAL